MNRNILVRCNVLRQISHHRSKVLFRTGKFQLLQDHSLQHLTANFSCGTSSSLLRCDTLLDRHEIIKAMASTSTQYTVNHDTKNKLFYIVLKESDSNSEAKLEYEWIGPTLVEMYHTEVPPQCQGKGIAKYLAKAAFDHFSDKKIMMRPSCTYLQKYLRENPLPHYMDYVEKEFKS